MTEKLNEVEVRRLEEVLVREIEKSRTYNLGATFFLTLAMGAYIVNEKGKQSALAGSMGQSAVPGRLV